MRAGARRLALSAFGLLVAANPVPAQTQVAEPRGPAAAFQYEIEFPQHQRLVRIRNADGAELAPFVGDGCSGGLSAGWAFFASTLPALAAKHGNEPPWEHCCDAHDRLYHAAGPSNATAEESYEARLEADRELRGCLVETSALRRDELAEQYGLSAGRVDLLYTAIAEVMHRAVRLGGAPCSGLSWRWGFGWPDCGR